MKQFATNHHFVPQGYLAGFTEEGTRDGRLFVTDLVSRAVFQTKPRNVGAERDFNRIDVDGQDPDALERARGEFEGRAISIIRGIQTSGELPADEEFNYILNLMALLIVRNPRSRKNMNNARHHSVRVIGDLLASDKENEAQDLSDTRNGWQEVDGVCIVLLGSFEGIKFEVLEQLIIIGDQSQIDLDRLLHGCFLNAFGHPFPVGFVSDLFADVGQVILAVGILDMSQEFGAFAHQVRAAPEQVTGGPHLGWVDVGLGQHSAAQQGGNLL